MSMPATGAPLGGADLFPAWVSYGNASAYAASYSAVEVLSTQVAQLPTWVVKAGTAVSVYTYVRNIGSGSSTSTAKVRFCVDTGDACGHGVAVQRIGGDVSIGALTPGGKRFAASAATTLLEGLHALSACVFDAGEQADALANDCTTISVLIIPGSPPLGYRSMAVCSTSGCNADGYGQTGYAGPRAPSETGGTALPRCVDGIDNDKDGSIDFGGTKPDAGCDSPNDNAEHNPERPLCLGDTERACGPADPRVRGVRGS